ERLATPDGRTITAKDCYQCCVGFFNQRRKSGPFFLNGGAQFLACREQVFVLGVTCEFLWGRGQREDRSLHEHVARRAFEKVRDCLADHLMVPQRVRAMPSLEY